MGTKCFLFEGQGAQFKGMGSDIVSSFGAAARVFDMGSDVTGIDLRRLCFEMDDAQLAKTNNAQLAIFALSMAVLAVLDENGVAACRFGGFSLGECSALCAAGVISKEDGFLAVKKRGQLMHECAKEQKGAMYAIIGLEDRVVEDACGEAAGYVITANYNCPGQLVIAGEEAAAADAARLCIERGAKKAVRLAVEGAFHTEHMSKAAQMFEEFVRGIKISPPTAPVYSNISGGVLEGFSDISRYLARHIISPVRWKGQVAAMAGEGCVFYEIGCSKTLSAFNRRIDKSLVTKSLTTAKGIEEVLREI